MVVAKLVAQLLPTLKIQGSTPVIGNSYSYRAILNINCFVDKTKIEKGLFFSKNHQISVLLRRRPSIVVGRIKITVAWLSLPNTQGKTPAWVNDTYLSLLARVGLHYAFLRTERTWFNLKIDLENVCLFVWRSLWNCDDNANLWESQKGNCTSYLLTTC